MRSTPLILAFFILSCQSSTPWRSEWKTVGTTQIFYAAVSGKASAKALESGSISMRRSTCVEATNLQSTSSKVTTLLIEQESLELTDSQKKDLGKIIAEYKLKPKQEACQSEQEGFVFLSPAWETCQCLYSIEYPGGRAKFREDLGLVQ